MGWLVVRTAILSDFFMSGMDVDDAQSDQPPRLSWQTANPDHTPAGSTNPPSIPQNPPNNSIPAVITANYAQISRGWQALTGSVAGTLRNFTQEPAQEPTSPPHQIPHDTLNINPAQSHPQSHPPALDHGKRQRVEEDEDTAGSLSPEQAPSSSSKVRLVVIDDLKVSYTCFLDINLLNDKPPTVQGTS